MSFMGDRRTEGLHWRFRLVLVVSTLCLPLAAVAEEERFCADYLESACRGAVHRTTLCQCFVGDSDLCCNLDGQPGNLEAMEMVGFRSVDVYNASEVSFSPYCGISQTVSFTNVLNGFLSHDGDYSNVDCLVDLLAHDSSLDNILSYRKVQLYRSSVTNIAYSKALEGLALLGSKVESVENITLSETPDGPSECLSWDDSTVSIVKNVVAMCDAHMDLTNIGQITETHFVRSRISSSRISLISTDGLSLTHGWHKMVNVTIVNVQKNGITFDSYTDISLNNVNIVQCDAPCIISRTPFVHIDNLMINGNKIKDITDSIYFNVSYYVERTPFWSNHSICHRFGTTLDCIADPDFGSQILEFVPDFSIPKTILSRFTVSLGILSHCFKQLELKHVEGFVRNVRSEDSSNNKDPCHYENRRISIEDADKISYIHSDYLDQLKVHGSEIQILDVSTPLSKVEMSDVKINVLENLMYVPRAGMKSTFNMTSVSMFSMYNLLLKSSGQLTYFHVWGRISNFTLDTPPEDTTTINWGMIHSVATEGIRIKSGILTLQNVRILDLAYRAVIIEAAGKLLITPYKGVQESIVCEKGIRIVVQKLSQLVFLHPGPTPSWFRDCTFSYGIDSHEMEDLASKFAKLVTEEDCTIDDQHYAACHLTNAESPILLGATNALDRATSVAVEGGTNLTVGDHCFDAIKLEGVTNAEFTDVKNSCYFELILKETSALNVLNNVYSLEVDRSLVKSLAPSATLESVVAANSTIRTFAATVRNGELRNVTIRDLRELQVLGDLKFINCTIAKLYKESIEVDKGAVLKFINSTINVMSSKSWKVEGSIHLINVDVTVAENETIGVGRDAYVTMKGVSFRKEIAHLFFIDSPPRILLNDVKMNKIPVKFSTIFEPLVSYLNGTVVGRADFKKDKNRYEGMLFCMPASIAYTVFASLFLLCVVVFMATFYQKRQAKKEQAPQLIPEGPSTTPESSDSHTTTAFVGSALGPEGGSQTTTTTLGADSASGIQATAAAAAGASASGASASGASASGASASGAPASGASTSGESAFGASASGASGSEASAPIKPAKGRKVPHPSAAAAAPPDDEIELIEFSKT